MSDQSSCSFLVIGRKPRCTCVKLTKQHIFDMFRDGYIELAYLEHYVEPEDYNPDGSIDVYLTSYLVDYRDAEKRIPGWKRLTKFDYDFGTTSGPHDQSKFVLVSPPSMPCSFEQMNSGNGVWLKKEHSC